jgi:hypothetical protein
MNKMIEHATQEFDYRNIFMENWVKNLHALSDDVGWLKGREINVTVKSHELPHFPFFTFR